MPDDMKQNIQAIRLSSIALPAVRGALVRTRETASADSVPIVGSTHLDPNRIALPCCLFRGKQDMRLIGTGADAYVARAARVSTQRLRPHAHA